MESHQQKSGYRRYSTNKKVADLRFKTKQNKKVADLEKGDPKREQ